MTISTVFPRPFPARVDSGTGQSRFQRFAGVAAVFAVAGICSAPAGAQIDSSAIAQVASAISQSGGAMDTSGLGGGTIAPTQATPLIGAASITGQQSAASEEASRAAEADSAAIRAKKPPKPGEYEVWLAEVTGRTLKRYGSDLLLPSARDFAVPATSVIPPDYALNVGDVVSISLTGSVEGSADFTIDRSGEIYLPNVGTVSLIGVRYRDLKDRIADAIGRKYRGYDVSVSIARLRGVRVYVTGFANNPGAYSVSSLSTLANAVLAAGGPSAGGSFRSVKLYRNGRELANFDLYELLRKGNHVLDPLLQNEDVLFIPPVGNQVAVIGSVNEEAIYEAKPGESLEDVVHIAGGPTSLADASRVILYRLSDRDTVGSRQLDRLQAGAEVAAAGDVVQVLPQGSLLRPQERQQVIVRLEGEVAKPGNFFVAPGTPLSEVVTLAGGLTQRAYVYGTRMSRVSVQQQQREGYREALDQMEQALAITPLARSSLQDAGMQQSQLAAARAFIEQLRNREPDGRLVLDVAPSSANLPGNIVLENNDRIIVPPRLETVGVFGAVYRPASFLIGQGRAQTVADFVEEAGGPVRGADKGNVFVVRANGSVLTHKRGAMKARVLAGDTIFMPVKTQSYNFLSRLRDVGSLLFQFGVGAAAITSAVK